MIYAMMEATTVEELISTLETFDAEHCVSIGKSPRTGRSRLEVWSGSRSCMLDSIYIPE